MMEELSSRDCVKNGKEYGKWSVRWRLMEKEGAQMSWIAFRFLGCRVAARVGSLLIPPVRV